MRHHALNTLLRLREFALEKEEQKLAEKQRDETAKRRECEASSQDLASSYEHTVGQAQAHDYLRRDKCVREAGNRHITDLRQLALLQRSKQAQVEVTLRAKQKADMISKVLEHRHAEELAEFDHQQRKAMDDISQNLFIFHQEARF
jgi:hypothetical protein